MSLLIFTLSCKTGIAERKIICSQIEEHQIPYLPQCTVSFKFHECRCRCFDYNSWKMTKLNMCDRYKDLPGTEISLPLEACEGIDGMYLEDEAVDVKPNVRALSNLKANLCQ